MEVISYFSVNTRLLIATSITFVLHEFEMLFPSMHASYRTLTRDRLGSGPCGRSDSLVVVGVRQSFSGEIYQQEKFTKKKRKQFVRKGRSKIR